MYKHNNACETLYKLLFGVTPLNRCVCVFEDALQFQIYKKKKARAMCITQELVFKEILGRAAAK